MLLKYPLTYVPANDVIIIDNTKTTLKMIATTFFKESPPRYIFVNNSYYNNAIW